MYKLNKFFRNFHNEQHGELRKVVEALAVGSVLLVILAVTFILCNGEIFKQSSAAPSTGNRVENAPGPMINTIIKSDKVADTITNDLTNLRTQVEDKPGAKTNNAGVPAKGDTGQGGG